LTALFYLGASVMVLVAGLLLVALPLVWRRDIAGENNIDWLQLRRSEIDQEPTEYRTELLTDAELRVVEELPLVSPEPTPGAPVLRRPWLSALLVVVAIAPVLIYYSVGSLDDVVISRELDSLSERTPESIPQLIDTIERRVERRPGNSDYLSLLGQYYTSQEAYDQALPIYQQLLEIFPESPEVLALAAQAEYLLLNRQLNDTARRRAQAALAADPNQRTALGTLGMAAFEGGDYDTALDYWQRLIAFESPGTPGYQMMAGVIAEAKSRGGSTTTVLGAGVAVTVRLPERSAGLEQGMVFVIARPAGSTARMPTAVVKRPVSELPLTVRLDDQSSMAGQAISALEAVDIEVQVSPSGKPGREGASWLATASNVVPSSNSAVEVILQATTEMFK